MDSDRPYSEPLRTTLTRTVLLAAIAAAAFTVPRRGLAAFPAALVVMLWPALGGHFIELAYLNRVRPLLSGAAATRRAVRLAIWFFGGVLLGIVMYQTAIRLMPMLPRPWTMWWIGGVGFVAVELLAHAGLQLRGRPSFYNGRG